MSDAAAAQNVISSLDKMAATASGYVVAIADDESLVKLYEGTQGIATTVLTARVFEDADEAEACAEARNLRAGIRYGTAHAIPTAWAIQHERRSIARAA